MSRFAWIGTLMIAAIAVLAADEVAKPLSGTVRSIDGQPVDLSVYSGKVVLVINVASHCGFTKQYKQLQAVYDKYKDRGLVVLGFPCNQFGQQEPGSDAEIKTFCENRFSVTFPMFSKIDVNGENALPLYRFLTSSEAPISDKGPVKWNFEKFLFNRKGDLIGRYRSAVEPDNAELIAAIETALAEHTAAALNE